MANLDAGRVIDGIAERLLAAGRESSRDLVLEGKHAHVLAGQPEQLFRVEAGGDR